MFRSDKSMSGISRRIAVSALNPSSADRTSFPHALKYLLQRTAQRRVIIHDQEFYFLFGHLAFPPEHPMRLQ